MEWRQSSLWFLFVHNNSIWEYMVAQWPHLAGLETENERKRTHWSLFRKKVLEHTGISGMFYGLIGLLYKSMKWNWGYFWKMLVWTMFDLLFHSGEIQILGIYTFISWNINNNILYLFPSSSIETFWWTLNFLMFRFLLSHLFKNVTLSCINIWKCILLLRMADSLLHGTLTL